MRKKITLEMYTKIRKNIKVIKKQTMPEDKEGGQRQDVFKK